jgi:predicted ATP-grasp superfamily ATP-dependent carboligase
MLAAVVEDFATIDGCEVVTTLDERFADRPIATANARRIRASSRSAGHCIELERELISELASTSDWSLIIAPETEGALFRRVSWVEQAGGRLLSPSSSAVAATTDKLECSRVLQRAGIPTIPGELFGLGEADSRAAGLQFPLVLKPRDGAGSQATFLINDPRQLLSAVAGARCEMPGSAFMLQQYVRGTPASVSVLIGENCRMALLPCEQWLSEDRRLRYCGGRVPLDPAQAMRARSLATDAVAAMPGLRGYVGVDIVLSTAASGRDCEHSDPDLVVEINPRLTTSYVGLRRLARTNLAECQVRVVAGESLEAIEWRNGTIGFRSDGSIAYSLPGGQAESRHVEECRDGSDFDD